MAVRLAKIKPLRIINAVAPIRICDNGGWTDTWFAKKGKIFNIGVYPYAEVQIEVFPTGALPDRVVIYAENFGERYAVKSKLPGWDRHPLLEAAIELMGIPPSLSFQATIFSEAWPTFLPVKSRLLSPACPASSHEVVRSRAHPLTTCPCPDEPGLPN